MPVVQRIEVPRPRVRTARDFSFLGWCSGCGNRRASVQLQIHQHDDLAARARGQQLSSIDTAPTRGQSSIAREENLPEFDTESFSQIQRDNNPTITARNLSNYEPESRGSRKEAADARDANKKFIWTLPSGNAAATKLDALELKGVYSRKNKAFLSKRFARGARLGSRHR